MRSLLKVIALILASGILITGCGGEVSSTGTLPEIGYPAPDFSLLSLDGARVTLADLRGKAVFINFWSVN